MEENTEKCDVCGNEFYANGDIQVIQFTGFNKGYVDFNFCKKCDRFFFSEEDVNELQIQVDRTRHFIDKYDGNVRYFLENFRKNGTI